MYNLVSLYNVICMCVFTDDHLVLEKTISVLYPREDYLSRSPLSLVVLVLCIGLRFLDFSQPLSCSHGSGIIVEEDAGRLQEPEEQGVCCKIISPRRYTHTHLTNMVV